MFLLGCLFAPNVIKAESAISYLTDLRGKLTLVSLSASNGQLRSRFVIRNNPGQLRPRFFIGGPQVTILVGWVPARARIELHIVANDKKSGIVASYFSLSGFDVRALTSRHFSIVGEGLSGRVTYRGTTIDLKPNTAANLVQHPSSEISDARSAVACIQSLGIKPPSYGDNIGFTFAALLPRNQRSIGSFSRADNRVIVVSERMSQMTLNLCDWRRQSVVASIPCGIPSQVAVGKGVVGVLVGKRGEMSTGSFWRSTDGKSLGKRGLYCFGEVLH